MVSKEDDFKEKIQRCIEYVGIQSYENRPYFLLSSQEAKDSKNDCLNQLLRKSELNTQTKKYSVPMCWPNIRLLGQHAKCEKAGHSAVSIDKCIELINLEHHVRSLRSRIYVLNSVRFAFADFYLEKVSELRSITGEQIAVAEYSGSRFFDSDIDITLRLIVYDSNEKKESPPRDTPFTLLPSLLKKLFPVQNSKNQDPDASSFFDINVYVANFDVGADFKCGVRQNTTSINSPLHAYSPSSMSSASSSSSLNTVSSDIERTASWFRQNSKRVFLCPVPDAPYGYYRIRDFFSEDHGLGKKLREVDAEILNMKKQSLPASKSNSLYYDAVKKYYDAVCDQGSNRETLNKLLFHAMQYANDQYYSSASYKLVVLPMLKRSQLLKDSRHQNDVDEKVRQYESALIRECTCDCINQAAWDNFGLMLHVVEQSPCIEPEWLSKVAKYMGRICKWAEMPGHERMELLSGLAKIRVNPDSSHFGSLFESYAKSNKSGADYTTARDALIKRIQGNRNNPWESSETKSKLAVLDLCFNFMIAHFDVFSAAQGGSVRKVIISKRLRDLFDIPKRLTGEVGLRYIEERFTKSEILSRVNGNVVSLRRKKKHDILLALASAKAL